MIKKNIIEPQMNMDETRINNDSIFSLRAHSFPERQASVDAQPHLCQSVSIRG
jgi:hypothetical protein